MKPDAMALQGTSLAVEYAAHVAAKNWMPAYEAAGAMTDADISTLDRELQPQALSARHIAKAWGA